MTPGRRVRASLLRLGGFFFRSRREHELTAEIESHIQLHIDDAMRRGLTAEEAQRDALARFGPVESIKDEYRDRGSLPHAERFIQDVRNGVRVLRRYPDLTFAAVATLALGVGANTAMVSLVDALMFRPPVGVREPERIVSVPVARNYVLFSELSRESDTLALAAQSNGPQRLSLGLGPEAEPIAVMCVTAGYFHVLGTPAAIGRTFVAGEDQAGHPRLIVLSHGFWRRRFGGSTDVLGRSLLIGGMPHDVVGVAPAGFTGVGAFGMDGWILLPLAPESCSFMGTNLMASRTGSWLRTIGRIRDDRTPAAADAEVARLMPEEGRSGVAAMSAASVTLTRDNRLALWLAAGALLVLLIACANVAGLLSVRAIERRREIAVRLQLGASRGRVFSQLLVENLVLAVLCGLAAAAVARGIAAVIPKFFPQIADAPLLDAGSWWLLAVFAAIASTVSALLPAVQAARTQMAAHIRDHQTAGAGRSVVRTLLIVSQMAVAVVLTIAAGLFVRSVVNVRSNLGFDVDRVVVATIDLQKAGIRRQAEIRATFDAMLQRVRDLPDVEAAALTSRPPLGSGSASMVMPSMPGQASTFINHISPGYFETMGTRILRGRGFVASDDASAAPVMVIDEAMAHERWPNENPIGKCGGETPGGGCIEVVGVAERRRYGQLTGADIEVFYPLARQGGFERIPQGVLVRTRSGVEQSLGPIARAIQSARSGLPFAQVRPLADLVDAQARSWRLGAAVFGMFGTLALILAAIGIYAMLAFAVRKRTREIGVRMALGADRAAVLRMVLGQGIGLAAAGCAAGVAGALGLARYLRSLLFQVEPADPVALGAAVAVLFIAALAGCVVPALRASRVDASVALRYD